MRFNRSLYAIYVAGLCCALAGCAAAPRYASPGPISETGKAPGARVHVLAEQAGERTIVIAFRPRDEVMAGLTQIARERSIQSAHFSGIGSFSSATLGSYDLERKAYREIPLGGELLEVVSFTGNVTLGEDGAPIVHVHSALSGADGDVRGGHLLRGQVAATLEVFVTELPTPVRKVLDPDLGSKLIE